MGQGSSAAAESGSSSRSPRGFWVTAALLGLFVACGAAPTPLYAVYAQRFHFSAGTLTVIFGVFALPVIAMLDQEPPRHPGRAALVIVTVSMGGQAVGAFASGVLVQYAPDPRQLVYLISLAAAVALVVAVVVGSDETVTHRHRFHVDLHLAYREARTGKPSSEPCRRSSRPLR